MISQLNTPTLPAGQPDKILSDYLLSKFIPFDLPDHNDWEEKAEGIRQRVLDEVIFKGVPDDWRYGTPQIEWTDTIETDQGYRIRKLRYQALPGLTIPALLYEPDNLSKNVPAVLNVNGHVGPPGKAIDYKQIRCINLAKRGVLALNPEWLKFGELQGAGYNHNNAGCLDLCGIAGVSVFYLAMLRGLDVIEQHPNTDDERVAVTGLSGGGWQTIILSALDNRVRLSVPVAGYIGLDYRIRNRGDIGDIEQNPADLATIADYPMLTAMLAPRPTFLIYNEKDDCCFQTHRAKPSVYDPINPLYEAYGLGDHFGFHNNVDPGNHNYDLDNRQQFYRFFNRHFLPDEDVPDNEILSDDEVLSEKTLTVGTPENNADFLMLAVGQSKGLPENGLPSDGTEHEIQNWRKKSIGVLKDLLRYPDIKVLSVDQGAKDQAEGLTVDRYILNLTGGWQIPVASIFMQDNHAETHVIITDEGKVGAADLIRADVNPQTRFMTADILLQGECKPDAYPPHQWAMMASAAGERFLGIQAAQLAAIIDWLPDKQVSVTGVGPVSGVVTLCAAALSKKQITNIYLKDSLASLKDLFDEPDLYDRMPSLFCFGLLKAFDMDDLIALVSPAEIHKISG